MKSFSKFVESKQTEIHENASWKVEIEGLPHLYFNGKSAGEVKAELRKLLKNPGDSIKNITRVMPSDIKKDFRLRLSDKADLEGEKVNEAYEDDEPASPDEAGMAISQLKFIDYAAEEIMDYVSDGADFPEWFQNKLTGVYTQMKDLHAYMEGENYEKDEDDDMEESTKAYGKSMEKQREDEKKRRISSSDKAKLGAIAQMMAREKKKKQ